MRKIFYFLCICFLCSLTSLEAQNNTEVIIPNRQNATNQLEKPYLILISVDGFKRDYLNKANTPFLYQIQKEGSIAELMNPSFPSITFPNHYTIVTGLTPAHHGVVGNRMYDPEKDRWYSIGNPKAVTDSSWYGGHPIWTLAESNKMLSACYYWPGSEANINGILPTYYFPYSESVGVEQRIQKVVDWLELPAEKRPHLITFYLPQVDHAGHSFGPQALETKFALKFVDQALQHLYAAVQKTGLPVNFILVSDHGMTKVDQQKPLYLDVENIENTTLLNNGTYASLFVNHKADIPSIYQKIRDTLSPSSRYAVYLKKDVPAHYEFSTQDDRHNRIGDIVFITQPPYYIVNKGRKAPVGVHGFHPMENPDMQTIFMAWGPQIKKNNKIEAFQNIHLYPLMAKLLGLKYNFDIDGDNRLIPEVLK